MGKTRMVPVEGVSQGEIDPDQNLISFSFVVAGQPLLPFVASPDVIEQMAMSLGSLSKAMREARKKPGDPQHAVRVARYSVQRDAFAEAVMLRFEDTEVIPYTFAIPTARASDIAERIQTESSRADRPGTA